MHGAQPRGGADEHERVVEAHIGERNHVCVAERAAQGAVGSVFVARRVEEKKSEDAQRFALKVPEYTGAAARMLSEAEFMRLFPWSLSAAQLTSASQSKIHPTHQSGRRLSTAEADAGSEGRTSSSGSSGRSRCIPDPQKAQRGACAPTS